MSIIVDDIKGKNKMNAIGNVEIGSKTFIIAEIGNNHIGDFNLAKQSLEAAARCGVDAVKFQTFKPELLVDKHMPIFAHVPDKSLKTQRERSKKMALTNDEFIRLTEIAKEIGIMLLTTPFDKGSADFIDKYVPVFKIASGDVNNIPLLDHVLAKGKGMLVSTGMCSQDEVDELVAYIPKGRLILFHCVASYPTKPEDANLSLIPFYQQRYQIPIAYSDHTAGLTASMMAAAMGAVAIEKHFILDRSIPAGDIAVSLDPKEMTTLVNAIREIDLMKGKPPRKLLDCEQYGKRTLRRTAYAKRPIAKDEGILTDDVVWLRPMQDEGIVFKHFKGGYKLVAKHHIAMEEPLTMGNVSLQEI